MKPILILALLASPLLGLPSAAASTPATHPIEVTWDQPTLQKLKTLHVNANWEKGMDIQDALEDLTALTRKADPAGVGVAFAVTFPKDSKKPNSHGQVVQRKLNISIENASVYEVLQYICEQTNLQMEVTMNLVVFSMAP